MNSVSQYDDFHQFQNGAYQSGPAPTSGYPAPTSGYPAPTSGYPAPTYIGSSNSTFHFPKHSEPLGLTQKIHDATVDLLAQASAMSQSILKQNALSSSTQGTKIDSKKTNSEPARPIILHVNNTDRSWHIYNKQTQVTTIYQGSVDKPNNQTQTNQTQQEKDKTWQVIGGLVATIVGLFTFYKLGQAVAEKETNQDKALNFKQLKNSWYQNKSYYSTQPDYRDGVDRIVKYVDRIMQRKRRNQLHKIMLLVLGLAACGIGFAGSVTRSKALIATSAGVGMTVVGISLYKLGYNWFSRRDQKDAMDIDKELYKLNQLPQPFIVKG